jgi:hypothetical protein
MAAGGMLPGGRQVHFKNASGKFMPPGGMEQRAEIRARLADIPRLAALQGWSQQPLPGAAARSQQPREVEARYRPPTPVERYWGAAGETSAPKTRSSALLSFKSGLWATCGRQEVSTAKADSHRNDMSPIQLPLQPRNC